MKKTYSIDCISCDVSTDISIIEEGNELAFCPFCGDRLYNIQDAEDPVSSLVSVESDEPFDLDAPDDV